MIDSYKSLIKQGLSKKRYQHSIYVADECKKIAKKYGANVNDAYIAGLLHDAKKDVPLEELKMLVLSSNIEVEEVELNSPQLWHAIASCQFARDELGISNIDILNAIRYHTVARPNMSLLEKIVYLGDISSEDRTYNDVGKVRKLIYSNLDSAMLYVLKFVITKLLSHKVQVPCTTIQAYNFYLSISKSKNLA